MLSDRNSDNVEAPIPSLLLTAAVHHHLVRTKQRTMAGLIVECGDAREVHHMALLIGYGAGRGQPVPGVRVDRGHDRRRRRPWRQRPRRHRPVKAVRNYIKACGKGVLKVMSKMGVSTVASYTGAQIFEAIGLGDELVDRYFTGTVSRLGGIGLDEIAAEVAARHAIAHPTRPEERAHRRLELGGEYQWRREGEHHLFNPTTVFKLQHATRAKRYDIFKEYIGRRRTTSRSGWPRCAACSSSRSAGATRVPIDEVEPVASILRRFSTGAMSYGSISMEAHETLAIAMNRIGGKSNTGEGGEDPERLHDPERRSAIKQVASGRFGVTAEYLTNADDLQIKMAQGAKPGEGGQLPGHKVYPWIAKTRHSTPGVGLISPPPHHDIYSIEDLKQLIHDLKNANPAARVHVKLVAEMGVGTVAAGVSKAKADVVLISGHDGGTGASPLTSLKHAGGPWELGLAETQQTLLLNGLRDRIVVQTDGQMKTGRDVVIAALLGAEEFGFATAPLVVSGCVMMRVCHLDTCPVGVATQNPELRARFSGKPEFVETFFEFVAEEVRELMAELGFRSMAEMIGHVELLDTRAAVDHWKASGLDLSPILAPPQNPYGQTLLQSVPQDHGLADALDVELIRLAAPAIDDATPVVIDLPIRNVNRTVGTMLGHEITKRWHGEGLPDGTIDIQFTGSAGQSFGAFVPRGVTMRLVGDANDYLGKGLSGGRLIVRPAPTATVRRRGAGDRRQRHRLRRDERRDLPARRGGRALLRAQLGRAGGRRGRRRPRLRVHDRWTRGRARADRASTSAPACRAASPTCTTPTARSPIASTARWSPSRRSVTTPTSCATSSPATSPSPARPWPSGCSPTGTPRWPTFVRVMPLDYKRVLDVMAAAVRRRPRRGRHDAARDGGGPWVSPRFDEDAHACCR